MRIIRAEDCRRMPWKNGGGETVEIAIRPESASVENFDWRLSMATVASDGPFSSFDGVDRTLAVLEGEGIDLDIAGDPPVRLTQAAPPFTFAADVPVDARLVGGPIRDLNLMTRRGRLTHRMIRCATGSFDLVVAPQAESIVFCASGWVFAGDPNAPVRLARYDAANFSAGSHGIEIEGTAFVCELRPFGSLSVSN
jgi:environmental stress-induced protein Ves